MSTEAQRTKIQGDARRAKWTPEDLHEHVYATYGANSGADLTKAQASALIDYIASGNPPAALTRQ